MRNLLAPKNSKLLAVLSDTVTLLVFDYDGTLAPIHPRPEGAVLRPKTANLLAEITRLYPSAAVSGRLRKDVMRLTEGARFRHVVGNHGLEWDDCAASRLAEARKRTRLWVRSLTPIISSLPGAEIENKKISLSLHYRNCPVPSRARAVLRQAVTALPGARVIGGKMVFNVLPEDSMDKGQALLRLLKDGNYRRALFVGDDVTDEFAFRAAPRPRVVTVRVGASRSSAADWYIPSQRDMDALLELLISLRSGSSRSPGRRRR